MSNSPANVLVVGSGPTALTAALTLVQNGIPVRIIEKDTVPRIGQRGAGISSRSQEIFESLGIIDEINKRAGEVRRIRSYPTIGNLEEYTEFALLPHETSTPDQPYRNFIQLGQDGLHEVLCTKLNQYGYSVDYGTQLVSLEQVDENKVKVVLHHVKSISGESDRSDSAIQIEEASYDYVIGADGAKGVVRKQLGLPFLGDSMQINMAVGDVRIQGCLSEKYWHMWGRMQDSLYLGLRGTENPGVFQFMLGGSQTTLNNAKELCQNHQTLVSYLTEHSIGNREDVRITDVICAAPYTPTVRMVDIFKKGNVFVAGDAAHIHSPAGAQGMNTGIQDGFNLAWKLAMVCKNWSPKSLLDTYNEERQPVVAQMLNMTSKWMTSTASSTNAATGWKRNGNEVNQLGVNYRWSSIVVDEGRNESSREQDVTAMNAYDAADCLQAGDRAPDAPGLQNIGMKNADERATRLFKLLSPTRHTVLILSNSPEAIQRAVNSAGRYHSGAIKPVVIVPVGVETGAPVDSCDVYRDTDGHAYGVYSKAAGKALYVVVRPDGVIGAIAEGVEWLDKYLNKVFL